MMRARDAVKQPPVLAHLLLHRGVPAWGRRHLIRTPAHGTSHGLYAPGGLRQPHHDARLTRTSPSRCGASWWPVAARHEAIGARGVAVDGEFVATISACR